jgi:carbon-monoxide dehydrogenase large subunit
MAEGMADQELVEDATDLTRARWVGARLRRLEDTHLLTGDTSFVDDLQPAHTLHAAFTRAEVAAARVASVDPGPALEVPGVRAVLTAADLDDVTGLKAVLGWEAFQPTEMPLLAGEFVRHVGEPLAMVLADTRHAAEDGAEAVRLDYEEQEPVLDMDAALAEDSRTVHDGLHGNALLDLTLYDDPEIGDVIDAAACVIEADTATGRLAALPMEGRACLAGWDGRDGKIVLHVSTQVPHVVRTAVARSLGLPDAKVRVVAPDVGGGFGLKCVVGREEILTSWAARRLRRPVKWVEDRQENLTASFHAKEQRHHLRAGFDADGRILGLDADIRVDVGAYSAYPFTCGVEPLMAATELPGPYRLERYRARARAVASNKAPMAPYRGVSRPGITLDIERLMEKAAAALGIDPVEVRRRNLVRDEDFPFRTVTGLTYDKGSYLESLEQVAKELDYEGWREVQDEARAEGRLLGLGLACFAERSAYGTGPFSQRKMESTPGFDTAHLRMDASGAVTVMVGTLSHGQGHATTLAQIVADELGVPPALVDVRQGDTDAVPFGWGTFASRSLVTSGEAAKAAAAELGEQLRRLGGELLEADPADLELRAGQVRVKGADTSIGIGELARAAHHERHRFPADADAVLEARASADPPGTFSNASHGALVEIDPDTGQVAVRRYVVVEDCGVVVNPMIVDGQVRGGVAQGIASALYERLVYDDQGQLITASLIDYLAPTAAEIPPIEVLHLETPSEFGALGAKGMGEGGTIGAVATIVNAVNDALRHTGTAFDTIPISPEMVLDALKGGPDD